MHSVPRLTDEACKGQVIFMRSFHEVTWSGFDPRWPLSHFWPQSRAPCLGLSLLACSALPCDRKRTISFDSAAD